MATCAFLGLGVMGAPMAGWLSKAGHSVTVWNRTDSKADAWGANYTGKVAKTAAEAVVGAQFVMMCVGNDQDAMGVFDLVEPHLEEGSLFIDHTTVSPSLAREFDLSCT